MSSTTGCEIVVLIHIHMCDIKIKVITIISAMTNNNRAHNTREPNMCKVIINTRNVKSK